jgi:hypothetical protein
MRGIGRIFAGFFEIENFSNGKLKIAKEGGLR